MENSRNKQFISFKLRVVLNSMMTSHTFLCCPALSSLWCDSSLCSVLWLVGVQSYLLACRVQAGTPGQLCISSPLVWELRSHKPSGLFKGKKRMLYVEPRGTIVGWPFHPGWFQPAFRLSKPTHLLLSCKILVPFCDAVTTNFIVMIWILIITAIDLE